MAKHIKQSTSRRWFKRSAAAITLAALGAAGTGCAYHGHGCYSGPSFYASPCGPSAGYLAGTAAVFYTLGRSCGW